MVIARTRNPSGTQSEVDHEDNGKLNQRQYLQCMRRVRESELEASVFLAHVHKSWRIQSLKPLNPKP